MKPQKRLGDVSAQRKFDVMNEIILRYDREWYLKHTVMMVQNANAYLGKICEHLKFSPEGMAKANLKTPNDLANWMLKGVREHFAKEIEADILKHLTAPDTLPTIADPEVSDNDTMNGTAP